MLYPDISTHTKTVKHCFNIITDDDDDWWRERWNYWLLKLIPRIFIKAGVKITNLLKGQSPKLFASGHMVFVSCSSNANYILHLFNIFIYHLKPSFFFIFYYSPLIFFLRDLGSSFTQAVKCALALGCSDSLWRKNAVLPFYDVIKWRHFMKCSSESKWTVLGVFRELRESSRPAGNNQWPTAIMRFTNKLKSTKHLKT